jgi:zinc transporter ZupT
VIAQVSVVAVATVAGAALARWRPGRQEVWFGAAAGALLVIAGLHLLPDAWHDARTAGLWPWAVPAVAVCSFAVASAVARLGCTCDADQEHASGAGTAAALAGHRFLEGATLALTGSVTVAVALAVHGLGEGLAVGALLNGRSRRRLTGWLAVLCAGPAVGAMAASAYPLPDAASPLLVAVAAGILTQAARVSLRVAFHHLRLGALVSPAAAATVTAAAVTAAAVHLTG